MNFTPQNILSQRYLDRKGLKPSILWIHFEIDLVQVKGSEVPEVESLRTSLALRTSSRTHFEVLGLEGQVLGLGLEASSPRKLPCPRLEDSTIFWMVKIFYIGWKIFFYTVFFLEIAWKKILKTLKKFSKIFFFWRTLVFVSLVLGLGLEYSCPWPWEPSNISPDYFLKIFCLVKTGELEVDCYLKLV